VTCRISKRTRDRAALICQIAASNEIWNYTDIARRLGYRGDDEASLAAHAYAVVTVRGGMRPLAERDAEAESLLRCGWSPGDKP
jgi:hypothetical protein